MSDIFISYSRRDIDFVRHLFDQLNVIYIESLTGWIIKLLSWTQNWCWRLADYFHFGSIGYWKPKRLFQFRFCRTRDILLGLEYRYSGLLIVKFQTDSGIFDIGIRKVAFDVNSFEFVE